MLGRRGWFVLVGLSGALWAGCDSILGIAPPIAGYGGSGSGGASTTSSGRMSTGSAGGVASTGGAPSTSGNTSSSSSASSSGTGGGTASCEGGVACKNNGDCKSTTCLQETCESECCVGAPVQAGTMCSDNQGNGVCDGSGSCVACVKPSDCPSPSTACLESTCTNGVCGTQHASSGTTCSDNGGHVCDGNGACVACNLALDCMDPGPCATATCVNNTCSSIPKGKGTACPVGLCDGNGNCTQATCSDGKKDGNETDTDCGGSCAPCADGRSCSAGSDCVDKVCAGGVCQPATCTDHVKNGQETDVDCGGSVCPKCQNQKQCSQNSDCSSGSCINNTCVSCSDGVKDGTETGVDCGGPQCDAQGKTCPAGTACATSSDCASGICQGGTCILRPNGYSCSAGSQCQSGACVGSPGICCNNACAGTCYACTEVLTGAPDGTCAPITANTTAPANQCLASPPCGLDGKCNGSGACQETPSGTACSSCSNGFLTPGMCNGSGACNSGTGMPCPNHLECAGSTSCKATCSTTTDCVSGYSCQQGSCVLLGSSSSGPGSSSSGSSGAPGSPCAIGSQCASGICGPMGVGTHCCAQSCSVGGPCGATDCDATGACVYPSGMVPGCSNSCSGSNYVMQSCSFGSCVGGGGNCGAYACNLSGCYTSCATSAQCATGFSCIGGSCTMGTSSSSSSASSSGAGGSWNMSSSSGPMGSDAGGP